jgi:hypothetical protein
MFTTKGSGCGHMRPEATSASDDLVAMPCPQSPPDQTTVVVLVERNARVRFRLHGHQELARSTRPCAVFFIDIVGQTTECQALGGTPPVPSAIASSICSSVSGGRCAASGNKKHPHGGDNAGVSASSRIALAALGSPPPASSERAAPHHLKFGGLRTRSRRLLFSGRLALRVASAMGLLLLYRRVVGAALNPLELGWLLCGCRLRLGLCCVLAVRFSLVRHYSFPPLWMDCVERTQPK